MLFHRPSALIVATLLIGCARSEAPLDADIVYDAPVVRVPADAPVEHVQTETDTRGLRTADVTVAEQPVALDAEFQDAADDVDGDGIEESVAIGGLFGEGRSGSAGGEAESGSRPDRRQAQVRPSRDTQRPAPQATPEPVRPSPIRTVNAEPSIAPSVTSARPNTSPPPPPLYENRFSTLHTEDLAHMAPGSEDYTDYGVNGFTNPEVDALSTFAVDVDTASYAVTRRKLRELGLQIGRASCRERV